MKNEEVDRKEKIGAAIIALVKYFLLEYFYVDLMTPIPLCYINLIV
jgi:hypothetical protein